MRAQPRRGSGVGDNTQQLRKLFGHFLLNLFAHAFWASQCTTYRNTENPGGSAPWTPALPGASRCAGPSVLGMGLPAAKGQLSLVLAAAVI